METERFQKREEGKRRAGRDEEREKGRGEREGNGRS
jgi:hypothetical protein